MQLFHQPSRQPNGYVALIALLVVSAAGLTIGLAVSLRGIEEIQLSFGFSQAAKAQAAANGCIELGLEHLRSVGTPLQTELSIGGISCILEATLVGPNAELHATSTVGEYTRTIAVQRDASGEIMSWHAD